MRARVGAGQRRGNGTWPARDFVQNGAGFIVGARPGDGRGDGGRLVAQHLVPNLAGQRPRRLRVLARSSNRSSPAARRSGRVCRWRALPPARRAVLPGGGRPASPVSLRSAVSISSSPAPRIRWANASASSRGRADAVGRRSEAGRQPCASLCRLPRGGRRRGPQSLLRAQQGCLLLVQLGAGAGLAGDRAVERLCFRAGAAAQALRLRLQRCREPGIAGTGRGEGVGNAGALSSSWARRSAGSASAAEDQESMASSRA